MRNILTIFLLFFYFFPIYPVFLPLPTDRLIEALGLFYVVTNLRKNTSVLSNKYLLRILGLFIVYFCVSFFAQFRNSDGMETTFIKKSFDLILFMFSSFLICSLYIRNNRDVFFIKILELVVYTFMIQGGVSLLFYFVPSLYTSYSSILRADINEGILSRAHLVELRLMGVGNAFFSGVIKYGVSFIILNFLRYNRASVFYRNNLFFYVSLVFIAVVGILTGRTFFIIIALMLVFHLLFNIRRFDKLIIRAIGLPVILALAIGPFIFLFNNFLEVGRFDKTFNFAFELFYNLQDDEGLSTHSSEKTLSMYVWPDNLQTWLFGDGKFQLSDGNYYMDTDVGYVRLIYYFGVIGTLVFFFIQYKLLRYVKELTTKYNLKLMFAFIFLWLIILNLKGIAYLELFSIFFIVAAIMDNNEKRAKS